MTPVVFVHGFMGGSAQWHLQYQDIGQAHRLICVDLPGFGKHNMEPAVASISGFADSVISSLDAMGVQSFHLMGHSMGGMIAQQIVRSIPERVEKLILFGTGAVGVLPGRFETIAESKKRAKSDGIKQTARRIAATWFLDGQNDPQFKACAAIAEQTRSEAFDAGLDAMENWSGEDQLSKIKSETMVIWGDRDRTYPWSQTERLWQGVTGARLAVVPGCAHAIHLEKPAIFNQHVLDFLRC